MTSPLARRLWRRRPDQAWQSKPRQLVPLPAGVAVGKHGPPRRPCLPRKSLQARDHVGVAGPGGLEQRKELPEPTSPLPGEGALASQVLPHVRPLQVPPRAHQVIWRQECSDRALNDLLDCGQHCGSVIDQRAVKVEQDQIDHDLIVARSSVSGSLRLRQVNSG